MRKRIFKIISFVIAAFAVVFVLFNIWIFMIHEYGTSDLETRKFNMLISGTIDIDPEMELLHALQWYSNWDHLFLSDNFKNKYKKRQNILNEVDELNSMSVVAVYGDDSRQKLIGISGLKKRNVFEMLNPDSVEIYRVYNFKYIVDSNGYLDDVELVGYKDFDAETGFPIGEDESEYHSVA